MTYKLTLIPGDGIGPEVIGAAVRIIEAAGVKIDWDIQTAGAGVMDSEGTPLPDRVLDSVRANKVALKGPITTPIGSGFRSVNVAIRRALNLYANVRPAFSMDGLHNAYPGVDLVVFRENTEGLYVGIEHEVVAGQAAEAIRIITRAGSERIVRFAFEYAKANGRKKVTGVHKANILKITDGLFLDAAKSVASDYPDITYETMIIDAMCMRLVQNPGNYDVLVMPNLYGDIVSDLASGLVGGLGITPGANIGDALAVFEPVHGSAPDIAGQDKANPIAAVLTGALMLKHLDENDAALAIGDAVRAVIAEGTSLTGDLLPLDAPRQPVGTTALTNAIISKL